MPTCRTVGLNEVQLLRELQHAVLGGIWGLAIVPQ